MLSAIMEWVVENVALSLLTDTMKDWIRQKLRKKQQKQLATFTYVLACRAMNELDWPLCEN